MDAAFGNWLAGFIDGEGCFTIREVNKNQLVYCGFSIEVRLDDADIIREIHRRMEAGTLKYRDRAGKNGNDKPQITWAVQSLPDCKKLAALLDKHPLRAKKKHDYAIWRLALDEQAAFRNHKRGTPGREEYAQRMLAYREALRATKRYDGGEIEMPEQAPTLPQLRLISS